VGLVGLKIASLIVGLKKIFFWKSEDQNNENLSDVAVSVQ